jgi:holo-[acyl-carrier protein] synthase
MTLYGMGTEIVEVARIARMIERHGESFLCRVFTEREIQQCNGQPQCTECFAALWAGKSAVLKSLGQMRPRHPCEWTDFEILIADVSKPQVMVGGASKAEWVRLRLADLVISLAHCRAYATATVLAFVEPGKS